MELNRKNVIRMLLALLLAVVSYIVFAKLCYIQRGYWAVGGEMFIPIFVLLGMYYVIYEEEHSDEE